MSHTLKVKLVLILWLTTGLAVAVAQDVVHAVGGTVTKVDAASKTIAVKTADGAEEGFKYSGKTVVEGSRDIAKGAKVGSVDTYMVGKEGTHVVVRYTATGADKTAVGVKDLGKNTFRVSKGTVTHVGKGTDELAVKTDEGAVETFHISKTAIVDSGHGVVKASEYSAKEGEKVTVHYTEEAGVKVAHLVKHL